MTPTYTLSIIKEFSASHIIPGHPGKCARLHGHNWTVEVHVQTHTLNALGMGVDFYDIKAATEDYIGQLDHQHLNDLPAFKNVSPTAEHIAAWLYQSLRPFFPGTEDAPRLLAVKIWETARCAVEYREEA